MDNSVEVVEAGTSQSSVQPGGESMQDDSFLTPTKKDGPVTLRRSPRTPKPKLFPDEDTPDRPFRSPNTAPTSPKTPKSTATSTPRNPFEFEVDSPASPNLEAVSSNDSFVMPISIRKVLLASPRKTPNKLTPGSSRNTPSKNTSGKTVDPLCKSGPSPYKSHRPKYLPKNIKLVKKKRLEREDFLQKVEQFDAQLVKLPSELSSTKRAKPLAAVDGDMMGTQLPLAVYFQPNKFFVTFDEHSFSTNSDMTITELVHCVKANPCYSSVKDYRNISLFLTVTSEKTVFDSVSLFIEDKLRLGKYVVDWEDLKYILVNLGLDTSFKVYDSATYNELKEKGPKPPQIWNFKFMLKMIRYSFTAWPKMRLLRLLKFVSDCLFDPILQECQFEVVQLLRQLAKYLLQSGVTVEEMIVPLNHSYISSICNRFIVQSLSVEPVLRPLTQSLSYRTIGYILNLDKIEEHSLAQITGWLSDVQSIMGGTGLKDIYQLISICENLAAISTFGPDTKTFLEKLADFAEHMSLSYSYFENLYFTETVTRLRTLSTVNHL